jgi:hypothetical protein
MAASCIWLSEKAPDPIEWNAAYRSGSVPVKTRRARARRHDWTGRNDFLTSEAFRDIYFIFFFQPKSEGIDHSGRSA